MVGKCGSTECPCCSELGYCMSGEIYCEYPEFYPEVRYSSRTYHPGDRSDPWYRDSRGNYVPFGN